MERSVNYTPNRQRFLDLVAKELPGSATITRKQVVKLVAEHNIKWPSWLTGDKTLRAGRGEFVLPTLVRASKASDSTEAETPAEDTVSTS